MRKLLAVASAKGGFEMQEEWKSKRDRDAQSLRSRPGLGWVLYQDFMQGSDNLILFGVRHVRVRGQYNVMVLKIFAHGQGLAQGHIPVSRLPVGAHHPPPGVNATG